MANVTLALQDDLLKQARLKAVAEGTTLNAVVRDLLDRYVHGEARDQAAAVEALFALAPPRRRGHGRALKRDELHER